MAKKVKQPHGGELHVLQKGETANPNGRPKKSFSLFNDTMKEKGYKSITKKELQEAYALIFNLDEDQLKEIAGDKSQPFVLRSLITSMNNKKFRDAAIRDFRDWTFGKTADEDTDAGKPINLTIHFDKDGLKNDEVR